MMPPVALTFAVLCCAQVTDTPGLLLRPDEYRNKMELLTLAALQYLPSSVMFVADLTGAVPDACGQWLEAACPALMKPFCRSPCITLCTVFSTLRQVESSHSSECTRQLLADCGQHEAGMSQA